MSVIVELTVHKMSQPSKGPHRTTSYFDNGKLIFEKPLGSRTTESALYEKESVFSVMRNRNERQEVY